MASFCIIKPRKRLTGWTYVSGNIWSSPYSGIISDVYSTGTTKMILASDATLTDGEWFFNGSTLFVINLFDPNLISYPGHTIEFPLYLSDQDYTAPSDPLDSNSPVVDWNGNLISIPTVVNGSSETLYGFTPLVAGSLSIANQNGFLNEYLHDHSFNFSECKAWIDGRQVFLGYTRGFTLDADGTLTITCADYNYFFEKNINLEVSQNYAYSTLEHPNLEPDAVTGFFRLEPWYKRRVFGMVDGHVCVNIDYNATPATNVNRDWSAMYYDGGTVGTVLQNLDHLAANITTETFFEDTPQVNEGDWVVLNNNGTNYFVEVATVDRALKYITHTAIVGRTFAAADTCTRYFIGRVIVEDSSGGIHYLRPGLDYTVFADAVNSVAGFVMADNWEGAIGFTESPFDPATHKLFVRVYGSKDLDQYSDATDVGAVAANGGVASQAVSLLFKMITEAGFPVGEIDKTSFADVGGESHSLGFAIPETYNGQDGGTYKTKIEQILSSMLWTLSFADTVSGMKLGLGAYRPFVSAGDYEADESEYGGFSFQVDYADIYSDFRLDYFKKETTVNLNDAQDQKVITVSLVGSDLNFVDKLYTKDTLHFDRDEAAEAVLRLSYSLGDRRGIYKVFLGKDYINSTNLGTSYNLSREQLPGFTFERGAERVRQLSVIEVQKNTEGVSISLDDQKGIQDNSGSW